MFNILVEAFFTGLAYVICVLETLYGSLVDTVSPTLAILIILVFFLIATDLSEMISEAKSFFNVSVMIQLSSTDCIQYRLSVYTRIVNPAIYFYIE